MQKKNPWKKLDSKFIYKNPWINVREDSVIRPDGKPGIYGVVETRKATGVVAINEHKEIYLVGQFRYTMDQYSWEIPEGGAEEGESPIDAIKRELAEEAGVAANKWTELGSEIHLSNCHSSERAYIFLAEDLKELESNSPEGTEDLQVKKVPFNEAIRMIENGEINDAITIIALYRTKKLLNL